MQLYLKILKFLKPFWCLIAVSLVLTFIYVIFNTISVWVSVDFVGELFSFDDKTAETVAASAAEETLQDDSGPLDALNDYKNRFNIYYQLKAVVKDFVVRDDRIETLKTVCLFIFLTFFLKNLTGYIRRVLLTFIELNIITSMRNQLHQVLLRLPIGFFHRRHSGELTSIVFNDVQAVNVVLNTSFGKMMLIPIQVIVILVLLIAASPKLSLITFVIIPVSAVVIMQIGQSVRRKSRRVFERISDVYATFQEAISAIRIVKAFTTESYERERFEHENQRYFREQFRRNRLSLLSSPLNETLGVSIFIVLLMVGGRMVYTRAMMAEDFLRYLLLLFSMFQPLKDLSDINNKLQAGLAAAERIFRILEEVPEQYGDPNAVALPEFSREIRYAGVCFHYDPEQPPVLEAIDLEILKGETAAFVGPSGAGKTTLVNLLPRFYEIDQGRIEVDGMDIQKSDLISLRKRIGVVTQDAILFNETVRANIAYGSDADDEAIIHAAKVANAWEFIEKMDQGLDTVIGERGGKLSGGQKQRLSIARAILKNPPILILDEATSALDTESERLVQGAIEHLMENRTVLVIAHRLSTVIHADKIVVMEQGKIVGVGRHGELLDACPLYRRLHDMQFREESGKAASGSL